MPGPEDKLDIIDAAMVNDDTDYGDNGDTSGDDSTQDDGKVVEQQREPVQKEPVQNEPVARPDTQPHVPDVNGKPQQQPQPNQNRRVGAEFMDAKGNIVDKTGKVIAQAGVQSRLWMENSRTTALNANLTRQVEQLNTRMQADRDIVTRAKEIAELPTKLGVTEEDYREGITLMRDWRSDPVKVAREVVARTLSFGHNLSDILGKSAGDAIEMKALTALIKQTTDPINQERATKAATTKANDTAAAAYQEFVGSHPHAETHGDAIANLMNKRGVTAREAYLMVKNTALEYGLDFSEPLGPQIDVLREQQAQQNSQPQRNGQRQPGAPLLNGGGARGRETVELQQAGADEDWGSILKGVIGSTG